MTVVLIGVIAGLAFLPAAASPIQSIVGGAPRTDLRLAACIAALFSLAAFGSAYWPARRAGRANPAQLLRSE